MLLFIVTTSWNWNCVKGFQNISCYCLSLSTSPYYSGWKFQNISCYCLSRILILSPHFHFISKHLMLLFILSFRFWASSHSSFQNISCYCLSYVNQVFKQLNKAFQNISCYCLSVDDMSLQLRLEYFKTSHVIVYPLRSIALIRVIFISKHLMLLFITSNTIHPDQQWYFKTSHVIVYLQPPDQQHSFHHHFKTSHVIVYLGRQGGYTDGNRFQNISCYCLSQELRQRAVM